MNNGEEAVGGESSQEKALLTLAVIDELAADRAVQSFGSFAQVVNLQGRPVFAETVRENPVSLLISTQADDVISNCLDASDTLNCYRATCVILYFRLDRTESSPIVEFYRVCKIRRIQKPRRSNHCFLAVSESILEIRLRYFMLRVICRSNPVVIDLRCYPCVNNRLSTISFLDCVRAVVWAYDHRQAVDRTS